MTNLMTSDTPALPHRTGRPQRTAVLAIPRVILMLPRALRFFPAFRMRRRLVASIERRRASTTIVRLRTWKPFVTDWRS